MVGKIAAQKNFFNGGNVVKDRYGHGTHVAGIDAALTNNGRGVAGGCSACKLLVAKVMDSSGGVEDANLIPAIDWSVKHGADVINLSFGGLGSDAGNEVLGATIRKAYARNRRCGRRSGRQRGDEHETVPRGLPEGHRR